MSTDSQKQLFIEKKLAQLDDFNLHDKVKRLAYKNSNDPAKLTTFKNLDKIKKNAKLKISKQLQFSNQTDLRFENPDLAGRPNNVLLESLDHQ